MITQKDLSINILVESTLPKHHCNKIAEVTYGHLRFEIDYYHIPSEDSNYNNQQVNSEDSYQIYIYDIHDDNDYIGDLCNGDSTIVECINHILAYLNTNLTVNH